MLIVGQYPLICRRPELEVNTVNVLSVGLNV